MNKVILIGNLAADPELRTTAGGTPVCTFRLAVQRRFANAQGVREADFFNVVAWRQLGELAARYLAKGRKCSVVGQLQNRDYEAQDGSKRYVTEVVADEIEFLSSAQGNNASGQAAGDAAPGRAEQQGTGFTQVDDEEMPF